MIWSREGKRVISNSNEAWKELLREAKRCVKLVEGYGYDRTIKLYNQVLEGKSKADEGYIMSLWDNAGIPSGKL